MGMLVKTNIVLILLILITKKKMKIVETKNQMLRLFIVQVMVDALIRIVDVCLDIQESIVLFKVVQIIVH